MKTYYIATLIFCLILAEMFTDDLYASRHEYHCDTFWVLATDTIHKNFTNPADVVENPMILKCFRVDTVIHSTWDSDCQYIIHTEYVIDTFWIDCEILDFPDTVLIPKCFRIDSLYLPYEFHGFKGFKFFEGEINYYWYYDTIWIDCETGQPVWDTIWIEGE